MPRQQQQLPRRAGDVFATKLPTHALAAATTAKQAWRRFCHQTSHACLGCSNNCQAGLAVTFLPPPSHLLCHPHHCNTATAATCLDSAFRLPPNPPGNRPERGVTQRGTSICSSCVDVHSKGSYGDRFTKAHTLSHSCADRHEPTTALSISSSMSWPAD